MKSETSKIRSISETALKVLLPESAGDTLDSFEKNLYKAAEAANNGYHNQFKHSSQVTADMGKRIAKDIKHKRFSNTVSLVDFASVQPDEGDAKYYINLAKREYVLFKSEYSKEEETSAGAIALPDVALFKRQKNEGVITALKVLLPESATEVNKLVTELDKKYQEKFKREYPDDLSMVYASKCGIMSSFLMSALQELESVSPEDYKKLVKDIIV